MMWRMPVGCCWEREGVGAGGQIRGRLAHFTLIKGTIETLRPAATGARCAVRTVEGRGPEGCSCRYHGVGGRRGRTDSGLDFECPPAPIWALLYTSYNPESRAAGQNEERAEPSLFSMPC